MTKQCTPSYGDRITADPGILAGKPILRGTRISVQVVLEQLADDPNLDEIFAAYPDLTLDDVKTALAYASDIVSGADVTPAPRRRRPAVVQRPSA